MAIVDIRATILEESSKGMLGKNNIAGDEVSQLVLRSEDPNGGFSEHSRANICDGHVIDPLLGPEISLSESLSFSFSLSLSCSL